MNQEQLQNIKAAALRYIADKSISDAKFANAIGISASAFSQYKRDAYVGNVEAVATAISDYLDTEIRRNQTAADFEFVETTVALQIREAMNYSNTLKRMVIITSPPGEGKTMALHYYANSQTVYLTARSTMHTLNMLIELAERMKVSTKNNADIILRRLITGFTEKPRTIIIDEAQHLRIRSLDAIRAIWDDTRIPVILSGNEELIATMKADPRHAQLLSRLQHIKLPRIQFKDAIALIKQRFPGMLSKDMRMIFEACPSTRVLCDVISAIDYLGTQQHREVDSEMIRQVMSFRLAA
jgi:DNA transposition AAA+ family ATPase